MTHTSGQEHNGTARKRGRPAILNLELARAIAAAREGATLAATADMFSVSESTVARAVALVREAGAANG